MLGPVLFLIYINNVSRNISSCPKLFADDMKVYGVLRDTNENVEELQKNLTRLEYRGNDWQLRFNTDKCKVMHNFKKNDNSSPQLFMW